MSLYIENICYKDLSNAGSSSSFDCQQFQNALREILTYLQEGNAGFLTQQGMEDFFRAKCYALLDVTGLPREISLLKRLGEKDPILKKSRKKQVMTVLDEAQNYELAYLLVRERA